jgi:hypothetical protein
MSVSVQAFGEDGKPIGAWTTTERGEHLIRYSFTAPGDEDVDLSGAIHQAIGAGSMCWENVNGAGVFDDRSARGIAAALEEFVNEVMRDREEALRNQLDNERARLAACLKAAEGQMSQVDGIEQGHPAWSPALSTIRVKVDQLAALQGGKAYIELGRLDRWMREAFPRLEPKGPDEVLDSVRRALGILTVIELAPATVRTMWNSTAMPLIQGLERLGIDVFPRCNSNVHKPE